jgi:hypothetical protein
LSSELLPKNAQFDTIGHVRETTLSSYKTANYGKTHADLAVFRDIKLDLNCKNTAHLSGKMTAYHRRVILLLRCQEPFLTAR